MTRTQRFLRAAGTVGVLLALAACSGNAPSALETPHVVYADGEPTGPFESDPAVNALRAALVAEAVAWNALDYSDPDLVYRWGLPLDPLGVGEELAYRAHTQISLGLDTPLRWTALGPQAMVVYDVDSTTDVTTIVVCMPVRFTLHSDDSAMLLEAYHVELFDDGSSRIEMTHASDQASDDYFERCMADEPPQGYFEPEPELFEGGPDDIKGPAPAEEYGFDNVS